MVGSACEINYNQQETLYMKGLYFPAQDYNFTCFAFSRNVRKRDFSRMGTARRVYGRYTVLKFKKRVKNIDPASLNSTQLENIRI